jgi:ATP-dependent Lon protease
MTGEITLRGRVLPIGGLREKVLAAHRVGIKKVLIPKDNEKDIKEIPAKVQKAVEIVSVEHMDEVLVQALKIERPEDLFRAPLEYYRFSNASSNAAQESGEARTH